MNVSTVARRALATTALAGSLFLGVMGAASAALVTDTLTGPGGGGTLSNGVTWSGLALNGNHFTTVDSDPRTDIVASQTLELSGTPTRVEFDMFGLGIGVTEAGTPWAECVVLPAGSQPISLSPNHTWTPATNRLCGANIQGNTSTSRFAIDNPSGPMTWTSNGTYLSPSGDSINQQIGNITVTADVEDVPVVSLPVLGAGAALAGAAFAPGLVKRARKNQDA